MISNYFASEVLKRGHVRLTEASIDQARVNIHGYISVVDGKVEITPGRIVVDRLLSSNPDTKSDQCSSLTGVTVVSPVRWCTSTVAYH